MEFADFLQFFNELSICRIINTSLFTIRKTWCESVVFGKWSRPDRAGGCVNNNESFLNNPQYIFEIDTEKPDEVLLNLDQLGLRYMGKDHLTIGFYVMRVEDNRKYRLHLIKPKSASSSYINTRSVFLRTSLNAGRYVVVPSTFDSNQQGEFMLRIYSENPNNLKELTKACPTPFLPSLNPFAKYPKCVTSIKVLNATGLEDLNNRNGVNSYVCIKCENKKVYGRLLKNNPNPEWDTSAIFYRYHLNQPIIVEVRKENLSIKKSAFFLY